jgi:arginase
MRVIRGPYHVDDYLPGLDLPLAAGDVITAELSGGDVWERLGGLYSRVAGAVTGVAGEGSRPVVVSGDCTTSLGTVAGLQRAGLDVGIVWLDAHGDVQTLETTASGYLGGLPLRLLVGYRPELIATRLGVRPVAERQVMLAGARDLDPPEVTYLAQSQIGRCEVADLGTGELPDGLLYLHIDLDVIDPRELPGLRYPAPGGPGQPEVATAISNVLGTGRVAAVGIGCTWHPGHGNAGLISPWLTAALGGDAERGRSG